MSEDNKGLTDLAASTEQRLAEAAGISTPEPLDLLQLDQRVVQGRKPIRVELKHPNTKKGTGQFVHLWGKDSPKVQDYVKSEVNDSLQRDHDLAEKGKRPPVKTLEVQTDETIKLLIVATDHWENIRLGERQDVTFTVKDALQLYAIDFVRAQLNEAMQSSADFTPA